MLVAVVVVVVVESGAAVRLQFDAPYRGVQARPAAPLAPSRGFPTQNQQRLAKPFQVTLH